MRLCGWATKKKVSLEKMVEIKAKLKTAICAEKETARIAKCNEQKLQGIPLGVSFRFLRLVNFKQISERKKTGPISQWVQVDYFSTYTMPNESKSPPSPAVTVPRARTLIVGLLCWNNCPTFFPKRLFRKLLSFVSFPNCCHGWQFSIKKCCLTIMSCSRTSRSICQ